MRSRVMAGLIVIASTAAFVACGSSTPVTPVLSTTTYQATLNAANEKPTANSSTATGTATYTLSGASNCSGTTITGCTSVSYVLTVTSALTGNASASHIHVGSAAVSGGVIVPFVTITTASSGNLTSGTIDLTQPISNGTTSITGDSLKVLFNNGNAYTNVHTAANAGGEIRGQIVPKP